jgi:hypothetical protein
MRKFIVATAVAGSIMAITSAAASGLGTLSGGGTVSLVNTGSVAVTTYNCTDALSVAYTFADASHQSITGVTLTGAVTASSTCAGQTASVVLKNAGGTYTKTASAVFAESSGNQVAAVDFSSVAYDVLTNPLVATDISVQMS